MIELRYGMQMITEKFHERYETLDDFKAAIIPAMAKIDASGNLAYGVQMVGNDWNILYYALYKLYKNHWFKSTDGELRDLRIADKVYNEFPRIKFDRALEAKLITQEDLTTLLTSKNIQNTAQHPATDPSTDSDEILGYIDAQAVGTQQNSIADLINTIFVNRAGRLEKWAEGFKDMFVSIFTSNDAPYFRRSRGDIIEEVDDGN